MPKTLYTAEFASTADALARTLVEALDALIKHKWCTREDSFCIRLCIEEALVNAVVHGNKNRSDRAVKVEIIEDGDRCTIRVKDQGEGFDPSSVEMPDCTQLGGRGVCLIKHYMDDVRFDCEKKSFEMSFSRNTFRCGV